MNTLPNCYDHSFTMDHFTPFETFLWNWWKQSGIDVKYNVFGCSLRRAKCTVQNEVCMLGGKDSDSLHSMQMRMRSQTKWKNLSRCVSSSPKSNTWHTISDMSKKVRKEQIIYGTFNIFFHMLFSCFFFTAHNYAIRFHVLFCFVSLFFSSIHRTPFLCHLIVYAIWLVFFHEYIFS